MKKVTEKRKQAYRLLASFLILTLLLPPCLSGCTQQSDRVPDPPSIAVQSTEPMLIPKPVSCETTGEGFTLADTAALYVEGNGGAKMEELYTVAQYLASKLRPATGYPLEVLKSFAPETGGIRLTTAGADPALGTEGYRLKVTPDGVTLTAATAEGLFRGVQTIRQLLPAAIEKGGPVTGVSWTMPCVDITDYPAYQWRGMMLDVARHFIPVEDVKRVIDWVAYYKMNRFHLHLTDDQGWRIEIKSRPELTSIGAGTQVGGGAGGYYTQQEYAEIISYAKVRYITVIPEIDMPGHSNAALASYGELNPDGKKKEPYSGIDIGFSSLMCRSEATYDFIEDVMGELAAITPGEYIHVGGDEASSTAAEDYRYFVSRVNQIVAGYGKKTIGWNPFDTAEGTTAAQLLQNWNGELSAALGKGMKLIMSPADKAYLDMKYDENTPIGLDWAGYSSTEDAYRWDPTYGTLKDSVIGIECALWSETVKNIDDIEYLAFPRLSGHAEVGWTPQSLQSWDEYKRRLASHGARMENQGIGFYKDPAVPWG